MSDTSFCLNCDKRKECKKICKPLESYLNKCQADEGYSDRHYKRKMIPFDGHLIENLASKRAMQIKYGRKWTDKEYRDSD